MSPRNATPARICVLNLEPRSDSSGQGWKAKGPLNHLHREPFGPGPEQKCVRGFLKGNSPRKESVVDVRSGSEHFLGRLGQ